MKESAMASPTYDLLTATFGKILPNLKAILSKAEDDSQARKIDPKVLLHARLAPDMLSLKRQVQIATDTAKGAMARLAGVEVPSWEDNEQSFADLQQRLDKTIDYVESFDAPQFDGAESRDIELKFPQVTINFSGREYVANFVLPNFYFHVTTAYDILRHNGVPLGKRDFLG
jgi:hypothetical protein